MRMLRSPWSALAVMLATLAGCGGSPNKGTLPTGPAANDEVSTPMTMEDVEASEDTDARDDESEQPDKAGPPAASN